MITTVLVSCCLLSQAEVPETPERWWDRITHNAQEVSVLQREIGSLRKRIDENDGRILQINKILFGVQKNIGQQINNCPYQKNKDYIIMALSVFALVGVIGVYNTIAGIFKKKPITINPDFLPKEKEK